MDRIGRYKIVRELGRGAMGVVYHAIDPNIGRPVAIKTIDLSVVRNPEEQKRLCERLFREARSAGILSHPGIVTIYDVEQQGELAYIAMEYVDGPTLDHVMSAPQPLPAEQIFAILGQTAAALDYAHQKGIVHRDIKPANIMIAGPASGDPGTAKITDFGIAKITTAEQFTMTGNIVGTPHYMSPEQVQGQAVDGRSDQFSLGVIVFEMLTGEKPYTGENLTTVVYKIVAEEPVPPHRLNATLDGPIESVLCKALSKKPDGRYRTCTEFVDSLEKACASAKNWKAMPRGGSLNEPTLGAAGRPAAPAITLPPARKPRRGDTTTAERTQRRKSNFVPFLLAILMAAALLALIGWQAGPWGGPTASEQETKEAAPAPAVAPPPQHPVQPAPQTATPPPPAVAKEKPSPMPSAAEPKLPQPKPTETTQETPAPPPEATPAKPGPPAANAVRSAPVPQPVTIISSPGGATATLDGRPDAACHTPCSLDATPGRHTIAITMPGYQVEHRQVDVGASPMELSPVVLRAPSGTLMVTSVPPGASVAVNGARTSHATPTELHLGPGTYKITLEKDGAQSTSVVEMRNGETKLLKVTLGR